MFTAIGYAAGGEYREEELDSRADPFKAAGDIFGFNAQESIQGSYDVREAFAELSVPILSNPANKNPKESLWEIFG